MISWQDKNSAKVILHGLSQSRTINDDGSTSFSRFGGDDYWIELLKTAVRDSQVTGFIHETAIKRASRRVQEPTPDQFIALYTEERKKLRGKKLPYLVAFSIWGKTGILKPPLPVLDQRVTFFPEISGDVSAAIERERERIRHESKYLFETIFSDHPSYETIVAKVYANAPEDAFERAYKTIAMIIGCTTFVDGSESFDIFGKSVHKPSLQLLIGPQSTVHNLAGQSAYEGFWYTEWVPKRRLPAQPLEERISSVTAEVGRVLDAVVQSCWREKCEAALLLYYDAFSEHQSSKSIFSGWRLLEVIAGGQEEKSDVLIRRVASFYSDSHVAEIVGLHLRARRNSATHGENWTLGVNDTCISQLRNLIRPMLGNFLINPQGFHSTGEFWKFCDATRNLDTLDATERILHAARQRQKALAKPQSDAAVEVLPA
ncbi:hypothetical protein GI374_11220 [Paracoccus sp. S-4012]|uniref:hypothetical protein n=1 Tax=Paracoccus sp. S-4012 TaxID=2665648 RepID=UPI0012B0B703|nr:hypothetical protein [Paracoccus sp. S-4012]MRX51007.1 hypothetical protein [Paracoccus sp. S-4012]